MGRPKKEIKPEKREYGSGSLIKIGNVWYLRMMHKGHRIKKSLHTEDYEEAVRKADAEVLPFKTKDNIEALEIVKARIATKEQLLANDTYLKRRAKWDSVMETYFKRGFSDQCSPKTRELYEFNFDRLYNWTKKKGYVIDYIDDFTLEMAEEFRNWFTSKVSDRTYNVCLNQFKWVWKCLEVKENIWLRFKPRAINEHTRRDLTFDEVKIILNHLATNRKHKANAEFNLLILTGIYTGQRLEDCCLLKKCYCDFTRKLISFIPIKTKKTGRRVNIPMFPILEEALKEQFSKNPDDEYVMPYMKHQYECRSIGARIRQLFVDCGIKTCERLENGSYKSYVSFHSFRYTFTKMMSVLHCPQNQVQAMLAHATPKMTSRYYTDDISVARRYVSALPQFDGKSREEQIEFFIDKSVAEELEQRKGDMTVSEYLRKLIKLDKNTIDVIEFQQKMLEAKKKEDDEWSALIDELMAEDDKKSKDDKLVVHLTFAYFLSFFKTACFVILCFNPICSNVIPYMLSCAISMSCGDISDSTEAILLSSSILSSFIFISFTGVFIVDASFVNDSMLTNDFCVLYSFQMRSNVIG